MAQRLYSACTYDFLLITYRLQITRSGSQICAPHRQRRDFNSMRNETGGSGQQDRSAGLTARLANVLAGGMGSGGRYEHRDLFIAKGKGAQVEDADGKRYIDYMLAFGPLILGHAPRVLSEAIAQSLETGIMFGAACESELLLAEEVVSSFPCVDKVRFTNSGTEAVQSALRLARAFTGRDKILKFEGHFHGWADNVFISVKPVAHMGLASHPKPVPMTPGQPKSVIDDIIIATWNDFAGIEQIMSRHGREIAAIILEPCPTNNGFLEVAPGFLEKLRTLTSAYGSVLIFDEVVSGFRMALGGGQELYATVPDLCTFGKAFAGGLPIAGFGGRDDIMSLLVDNAVSHLGTYNSGALSCAGALAVLRELKRDDQAVLKHIQQLGKELIAGFNQVFRETGAPLSAGGPGAVVSVYGSPIIPRTYRDVLSHNKELLSRIHRALLQRGIWSFARGTFMISAAHTEDDIQETIQMMKRVLTEDIKSEGACA
ncbi:aspartate aminotransferase family protein [Mesorhizobium sp.]|uniref:aspartate aminotransferase family protein n=1 Tax=Mesorhizobium sp. TaxID=1871066 RepID=UPI000FE7F929|nr:aspartate aminotransferase family protein [Mesorhizobium sp.]RWC27920.1 MAG: aspartate aminotransferase family protein [Mesorhizobium sp.]TIX27698.1 MAG: aspartate aminotransferase family protein [Mesorhizobium sp.]